MSADILTPEFARNMRILGHSDQGPHRVKNIPVHYITPNLAGFGVDVW